MKKHNKLLDSARRAAEVITDFRLKDRFSDGYTRIDPALLACKAEVTVMYRPLEKLLGGFIREDGSPGILVNSARPRGLVHMTCAHELGHFFLGHDSTADETIDFGKHAQFSEQQANHFAYSLLAPQWLVASVMRLKGWTRADLEIPLVIYQLSLRLGTSYTAMVWSLYRSLLLTAEAVQQLLKYTPKQLKQGLLGGRELPDANADVWFLNSSDRDRILEPGYGDRFVIDLPNHAGSGHLWSVSELASEGFILEPFLLDARTEPRPSVSDTTIGGGKPTIRYALYTPDSFHHVEYSPDRPAQIQHRKLIAMQEKTPWSNDIRPNDEFSFSTEFEEIKDGFSTAERARRIAAVRDIE
jgi:Zn-dependent peptidase ImmA (M78 family)